MYINFRGIYNFNKCFNGFCIFLFFSKFFCSFKFFINSWRFFNCFSFYSWGYCFYNLRLWIFSAFYFSNSFIMIFDFCSQSMSWNHNFTSLKRLFKLLFINIYNIFMQFYFCLCRDWNINILLEIILNVNSFANLKYH